MAEKSEGEPLELRTSRREFFKMVILGGLAIGLLGIYKEVRDIRKSESKAYLNRTQVSTTYVPNTTAPTTQTTTTTTQTQTSTTTTTNTQTSTTTQTQTQTNTTTTTTQKPSMERIDSLDKLLNYLGNIGGSSTVIMGNGRVKIVGLEVEKLYYDKNLGGYVVESNNGSVLFKGSEGSISELWSQIKEEAQNNGGNTYLILSMEEDLLRKVGVYLDKDGKRIIFGENPKSKDYYNAGVAIGFRKLPTKGIPLIVTRWRYTPDGGESPEDDLKKMKELQDQGYLLYYGWDSVKRKTVVIAIKKGIDKEQLVDAAYRIVYNSQLMKKLENQIDSAELSNIQNNPGRVGILPVIFVKDPNKKFTIGIYKDNGTSTEVEPVDVYIVDENNLGGYSILVSDMEYDPYIQKNGIDSPTHTASNAIGHYYNYLYLSQQKTSMAPADLRSLLESYIKGLFQF